MFNIYDDDIRDFLFKGFRGCTNGNCVVRGRTSGMHTNGSCSCVVNAGRSQLHILNSRLQILCDTVDKMQDEQDAQPPAWWKEFFRITSQHDIYEDIIWSDKGRFAIICNDVFHWACSDAEEVGEDDLQMLDQAMKDGGFCDGPMLYCARKRQMRPQGAMYGYIEKQNWPLFDAAGPERDPKEFGNTPKPKQ